MNKFPISVVCLTYNEERSLGACLQAVHDWVNEILIFDMHSTDKTVEIAKSYSAQIEYYDPTPLFDAIRNRGIDKAKNDWILLLDADEVVSEGLKKEIQRTLQIQDADLLMLPRANYAFGKFLAHVHLWPEWLPRCFNKNAMAYKNYKGFVHTLIEPKAHCRIKKPKAKYPTTCLHHYSLHQVDDFLVRIHRYTTMELERPKNNINNYFYLAWITVYRPLRYFFIYFILRKGWMDGWRGWWLSVYIFMYQLLVAWKVWERLNKRREEKISKF